jgi:ankyrin repeat protein
MKYFQPSCIVLLLVTAACSTTHEARSEAAAPQKPGIWQKATGWTASLNPGRKKAAAEKESPRENGTGLIVKTRAPDSAPAAAAKTSLRTKQFAAALRELQAAAERGDVQSQYLLGLVQANGLGTPVSDENARRWLTASAEKSNPDAAYALAGLLAGSGSAQDRAAAERWVARAASEGHPVAVKLVDSLSLPLAPARGASGNTTLARELTIWAIRHGDEQSLAIFVKAAGIESADEFGRAPLAYAVANGSEPVVRQLLAAGASPGHADHFGVTPVMLAAEAENTPILSALLQNSKDVNARDSVGNTALFYAARVGRLEHVEGLLAAGAVFDVSNSDGWTVLDVTSKAGHTDVAQVLRKAGATGSLKVSVVREGSGVDPTRQGEMYNGWPAVAIAASRNDARVVEKLLADGARGEELTPQRDTPLIVAAKYRAPKVIAPLLKAGANPARADDEGSTALGYAAAHGAVDVIDAMLQKGVSPDTRGKTEEPPLVRAARADNAIAVKRLIDAGADVNATLPGGMTALMVAAAAPDPEIVQMLMAANPNLTLKDRSGRNALWFAAGAGNDQIVDVLLAAGSPIDGSGTPQSPLFAAVQAGRAGVLERLLRKGLPPDAKDAAANTPLIAAASRGDKAVVRILLDGGATVDAQNAAGNTALIVAAREGQTEVFKMLLKAGANAGLHNLDRINALDTARRRNLGEIVALLDAH